MSTPPSSGPVRRPVSPYGRRRSAAGQPQRSDPLFRLQLQRVRSHQADEVRGGGMAPAEAFGLTRVVDRPTFIRQRVSVCVCACVLGTPYLDPLESPPPPNSISIGLTVFVQLRPTVCRTR